MIIGCEWEMRLEGRIERERENSGCCFFFYFVVDGWGVVLAYEVMMVQQGGY